MITTPGHCPPRKGAPARRRRHAGLLGTWTTKTPSPVASLAPNPIRQRLSVTDVGGATENWQPFPRLYLGGIDRANGMPGSAKTSPVMCIPYSRLMFARSVKEPEGSHLDTPSQLAAVLAVRGPQLPRLIVDEQNWNWHKPSPRTSNQSSQSINSCGGRRQKKNRAGGMGGLETTTTRRRPLDALLAHRSLA